MKLPESSRVRRMGSAPLAGLCITAALLLTLAGCSGPVATSTGTARLSWTAPAQNVDGTPIQGLAGYRIRYGTSPAALDRSVQISDPGVTTYLVQDLSPGTWYFAVHAYTRAGLESAPSSVASKTIR